MNIIKKGEVNLVELSYKEKVKQIRREGKKRFRNPYKVGDILHHSFLSLFNQSMF